MQVKRNYYHLRSKETNPTWKQPIRIEKSPLATRAPLACKVNTRKDTFYINCGYNTLMSYKRESQDRIRAAQNGASIEEHWNYHRVSGSLNAPTANWGELVAPTNFL